MFNHPMTKEEAEKTVYDKWAGNPRGNKYDPERCAHSVWVGYHSYQCARKNGNGPSGLYCKQHAKKLKEREDHE